MQMRTSQDVSALDITFENWIEHVTFGLHCVMLGFSARIIHKRAPGFAADCPCGV